jgi:Arc/MetJ-type ribon-helix-helix transcriptional regulator
MARTRGRPPRGRGGDKKVTIYLPPEDIAALDRLADRRTVTGKNTSRTDLVREAVKQLLEAEGMRY